MVHDQPAIADKTGEEVMGLALCSEVTVRNLGEEWAAGNADGRRQADAIVERMRATGSPNLLKSVAQAIGARDPSTGIAVGFYNRLAERLIA